MAFEMALCFAGKWHGTQAHKQGMDDQPFLLPPVREASGTVEGELVLSFCVPA